MRTRWLFCTVAIMAALFAGLATTASVSVAASSPAVASPPCAKPGIIAKVPGNTALRFPLTTAGFLDHYCQGQVGNWVWAVKNRTSAPATLKVRVSGPADLLGIATQPATFMQELDSGPQGANLIPVPRISNGTARITLPPFVIPPGATAVIIAGFTPEKFNDWIQIDGTVKPQAGATITLRSIKWTLFPPEHIKLQ